MASSSFVDTLTHIETPENVRLAFRLAGPGARLGAYLLDLLLRLVIVFGLMTILSFLTPVAAASGLTQGIFIVGLFLVEWGYGCLFESLWNGQTPGKKALNLRVIKAQGYPIGFYEALLRNLLRAADILPFFYAVGFVTSFLTPRMQRIGDLVAGTLVVREPRQHLREELAVLRSVQPIPMSEVESYYRPSERTLDLIERLMRRQDELAPERVEEIARILAPRIARRLGYPDEKREALRQPSHFLLRVLRTFQQPEEVFGLREPGEMPAVVEHERAGVMP